MKIETNLIIFTSFVVSLQNQNSSAKLNGAINNQSYKEKFQRKEEMQFMKQQQRNDAFNNMTNLFANQQKRISVQDVEQQQHHVLARTVSTPITEAANQAVVNNLFTSLNDILNGTATNGHRKLERTQSEPLPQTNTSRYAKKTHC